MSRNDRAKVGAPEERLQIGIGSQRAYVFIAGLNCNPTNFYSLVISTHRSERTRSIVTDVVVLSGVGASEFGPPGCKGGVFGVACPNQRIVQRTQPGLPLRGVRGWRHAKEYGYDAYGNRTSVIDADGNTRFSLYDSTYTTFVTEARNALYSTATAQGQHQRSLSTWEPRCSAPLTQTDGNDQTVTTLYDPLCRVTQVNRPGGDGSAQGNQENHTYHLYDGATTTTSNQYVYVTTNASNGAGLLYSYRYVDGRGRTWQTQSRGSSGDIYTQTIFNTRGSAVSTSTPIYWNGTGSFPGVGPTRTLDDLGRPVSVTYPDNSYITWSYCPNTVTVVDELGHTMTETTDARGHLVNHTEYEGTTAGTTQYTYDDRGALSTVRDPAGNVTQSFVDSLGRPYKLVDPDRGTVVDDYDPLGHVLQETDALGQVTLFRYDALGRMTSKLTRAGTAEAVSVSWGYDERYGTGYANMGHRTSASDPYGTQTDDFNSAGLVARRTRAFATVATPVVGSISSLSNGDKLVRFVGGSPGEAYNVQATSNLLGGSWTTIGSAVADTNGVFSYQDMRHLQSAFYRCVVIGEAGTYTFTFAYDAGGRLKGTRYPDGDVIGIDPQNPGAGTALAYDNAGRLYSISAVGDGTLVSSVSYDAQGNAIQQNNANGTVVSRTFDSSRNWMRSVSATKGAATLFSLTYGRDAEGKILSLASDAANETWSYGYDGLHRLTTATNAGSASDSQTFAYDTIGNMTSNSRIGSYAYRGGGGGCSDAATTGQPHAVSCAGGVSYKYDASGNMVSGSIGTISYDGSNMPVSAGDYGYTYSADNDRLTVSNSGQTTVFLGGSYEISPTGVTTKLLPFGVKRKGTTGNWTSYWLHSDGQGSTRVVTDASGAVQQRMSYRPYGEILSQSSSLDPSVGYTGQRFDGNGLVYLHARYLDPKLGRFISADPTSSDGLNRYSYVRDNPISFVDHSGYGSTPNETYMAAIAAGGLVAEWADAPRKYGTIGAGTSVENRDAAWQGWFTGGGETYDGTPRVGSPQFSYQLFQILSSLVPVGEMAALARAGNVEMAIEGGVKLRPGNYSQPYLFEGKVYKVPLGTADPGLADATVGAMNQLRDAGLPIPATEHFGGGVLVQDYAPGLGYYGLSFEVRSAAYANVSSMVEKAESIIGYDSPLRVDWSNLDNFRFDRSSGAITSWFDPVFPGPGEFSGSVALGPLSDFSVQLFGAGTGLGGVAFGGNSSGSFLGSNIGMSYDLSGGGYSEGEGGGGD